MNEEDYKRIKDRMKSIPPEADAAVLVVKNGADVTVTTAGEPMPLMRLKWWMFKWLGGQER